MQRKYSIFNTHYLHLYHNSYYNGYRDDEHPTRFSKTALKTDCFTDRDILLYNKDVSTVVSGDVWRNGIDIIEDCLKSDCLLQNEEARNRVKAAFAE